MGGTDDPSNLIELTVEEHAQAHLDLYEEHGRWQDQLAYRMLSGSITNAEAIQEAQRQGQVDRWAKYTPEERSAMKKGENNGMYGKKGSQKQKEAVRKAVQKPITLDGVLYPSRNAALAAGYTDHFLRKYATKRKGVKTSTKVKSKRASQFSPHKIQVSKVRVDISS